MLIINTSYTFDGDPWESSSGEEMRLLDLTGKISGEYTRIDVGAFGDIDQIYVHAQQLYSEFSEQLIYTQLDGKPVIDYEIKGLPLFWMTAAAIKHPITHWGRTFFILLSILKHGRDYINKTYEKLHILIQPEIELFQPQIIPLIQSLGIHIDTEVQVSKHVLKEQTFAHLLKSLFSHSWKMLSYRTRNQASGEEPSGNLFLTYRLSNTHTFLNQFLPVKKLLGKVGQKITLLPFTEWAEPSDKQADFPQLYQETKPGFWELLGLNLSCLRLFLICKRGQLTPLTLDGFSYQTEFLRQELIHVLTLDTSLLFSYYWLKKYASRIASPLRMFFEDEFYKTGKIVAAGAAKNPMIKSFGIQHGHFNEAHTVYMLGDVERKAENKNPLPDTFIVWGDYYNNVFRSPASLPIPDVLSLGSPKYIDSVAPSSGIKNKQILWCLTSKECFALEWEMIKSCELIRDFDLWIRLHPVPHVSKEEVEGLLGDFPFRFSEEDRIEEAIGKVSIVMMSAHSTVFLDAILQHKYSIRLVTNRWIGSSVFQSSQLQDVHASSELSAVLRKVEDFYKDGSESLAFLELKAEKWMDFLLDKKDRTSSQISS